MLTRSLTVKLGVVKGIFFLITLPIVRTTAGGLQMTWQPLIFNPISAIIFNSCSNNYFHINPAWSTLLQHTAVFRLMVF